MADRFLVPSPVIVDSEAESGYFFRRVGEIAFSAESEVYDNEVKDIGGPLGRIRRLDVAGRHGVVVFSDFRGRQHLLARLF